MKNKTALSAALIYVIIKFIFTLLSSISALSYGSDILPAIVLLKAYYLWFFTALALVIALFIMNKKQARSLPDAFNDSIARKSVGLVILISVLLTLPITINICINIYTQSLSPENGTMLYPDSAAISRATIISGIISLLYFICMLILGLYLLIHKQKHQDVESEDNSPLEAVPSIALLFISVTFIASLLTSIINCVIFHPPYLLLNSIPSNSKWTLLLSVITIILLYFIIKKRGESSVNLLKYDTVRYAAAMLVITDGLLALSMNLPQKITQYNMLWQAYKEGSSQLYQFEEYLLHYISAQLLQILQIIFGIWLLTHRSKTTDLVAPDSDSDISDES